MTILDFPPPFSFLAHPGELEARVNFIPQPKLPSRPATRFKLRVDKISMLHGHPNHARSADEDSPDLIIEAA